MRIKYEFSEEYQQKQGANFQKDKLVSTKQERKKYYENWRSVIIQNKI